MISIMAAEPTILALSNPDPEILPEKLLNIRPDLIDYFLTICLLFANMLLGEMALISINQ